MYSKAGILSVELYPWLQQKDQILNKKKQFYHMPLYGEVPHAKIQVWKDPRQQQSQQSKKPPKSKQPFSKITPRKDPKAQFDRQGLYYPKYHLIFKKSPLIEGPDNHTFIEKPKVASERKIQYIDFESFPKPLREPKGLVEMDKMFSQDRFPVQKGHNEKRFELHELPQSQFPKSTSFTLNKSVKQEPDLRSKNGQIYDQNYEAILPKSDKMIPDFNRMTARKPIKKVVYTLNESSSDTSIDSGSFRMDKQLSRDAAQKATYNSARKLYYL